MITRMGIISAIMGLLAISAQVQAEQIDYLSAQKAGFLFQLSDGPRGIALGQAAAADTTGIEALIWNPAGLDQESAHAVGAAYSSLSGDMSSQTLSSVYHFSLLSIGLMLSYFNYGAIERFSLNAYGYPVNEQETFRPYSLVSRMGLAMHLSQQVSLGLAVKWLREDFSDQVYNYVAGDVGVQSMTGLEGLAWAVVVKHIGRNTGGFSLPLTTEVGLAYRLNPGLVLGDELGIFLSGSLPQDRALQAGLGVEYQFLEMAHVRVGYHSSDSRQAENWAAGFSAGAGLHVDGYSLQYAFTPNTVLGDEHHLALVFQFGGSAEPGKKNQKPGTEGGSRYLFDYLR